jgi:hypothetical protein
MSVVKLTPALPVNIKVEVTSFWCLTKCQVDEMSSRQNGKLAK